MRRVLLALLIVVAAANPAPAAEPSGAEPEGGDARLVGATPHAVFDEELLLTARSGGFSLFRKIGRDWQATDVIEEFPNGFDPHQFTAVDGDWLIVPGDYGYNEPTVIQAMVRRGSKWFIEQTIEPEEYFGEIRIDGDRFIAVALAADHARVIAVYERTGPPAAPWERTATIPQPADVVWGCNQLPQYGRALALQGDEIFVGAYGQNSERGSVYVFHKTGSGWAQTQKIVGPVAGGGFGGDIDVDGSTLAVGSRLENGSRGAVRIYGESNGRWYFRQRIGGTTGEFGFDLSLAGDALAVGAPVVRTNESYKGRLYHYQRNASGTFVQTHMLEFPDEFSGDRFGVSVATNGWVTVGTFNRTSGLEFFVVISVGAAPDLCRGFRVTITGTDGDDEIRGTGGDDVIKGLDGDDSIKSFGGHDVVCAGKGEDLVLLGAGNDLGDGGPGADLLRGGTGDDQLLGAGDRDHLEGGPGDDTLDGGPARDTAVYSRAAQGITLDLEDGISVGDGTDTLTRIENVAGTYHDDEIRGDDGVNAIRGFGGNDELRGMEGDDFLYAAGGYDRVFGYHGDDIIAGGSDDDWLDGGTGFDTINGGQGIDYCEMGLGNKVRRCELVL